MTKRDSFRHEALFYAGEDEFLAETLPFIKEGILSGEPVLVAVSAAKIDALRAELGELADRVSFKDVAEIGPNPARIIPVWREFVDEHARGGSARGIGEPIWAGRSAEELVEGHHHEALLNLAFADAEGLRLLCAYDTAALDGAVIAEAMRTHPLLTQGGARVDSDAYEKVIDGRPFHGPLTSPPPTAKKLAFRGKEMHVVRDFVARPAIRAGMDPDRAADLVLAADEIATNSIRHGGGAGTVMVWRRGDDFICEVRDEGAFDEPLVGRVEPTPTQLGERGVWVANQLCDLVQIRSAPGGSAVRLHMKVG